MFTECFILFKAALLSLLNYLVFIITEQERGGGEEILPLANWMYPGKLTPLTSVFSPLKWRYCSDN